MFVLIICENVEKMCMFLPTIGNTMSISKQESAVEYEKMEDCSVTTI